MLHFKHVNNPIDLNYSSHMKLIHAQILPGLKNLKFLHRAATDYILLMSLVSETSAERKDWKDKFRPSSPVPQVCSQPFIQSLKNHLVQLLLHSADTKHFIETLLKMPRNVPQIKSKGDRSITNALPL